MANAPDGTRRVRMIDAEAERRRLEEEGGEDVKPPSDESLQRLDELAGSGTSYLEDSEALERRSWEAERRARRERGLDDSDEAIRQARAKKAEAEEKGL